VISPVIATPLFTGVQVSAEIKDVAMVTPRRRAVLRDPPGRHVDVDVVLRVEVRVDAEALGARAGVAHRGLRRLLHHVPELAGERQSTFGICCSIPDE